MRTDDLSLLLAEWQGHGLDTAAAAGARAAAAVFPSAAFVEVGPPDPESPPPLPVEDAVIGLQAIADRARRTLDLLRDRRPARLFTVGGTCGAELAPVAYLNDRYRGDLAVVWLDAHGDLNTPQSSPSGRFHGMVLRTLLGAGPKALVDLVPRRLAPTQIVLAGTRDLDRDEALFISDTAVSMLTPADLLVPDRAIGRIRAAGFTKVYVHLDLDVMDPAEFRDTLVSAPGGISVENTADTIHGIADTFDVVGFSVMEFQPRAADAAVRLRHLLDRCGITIGALDRSLT